MQETFDLIVIGGGPGGYVGAIRAAQLGMKVALVEKRSTLGGTCLNVGCIPSKALLDSSEQYVFAKEKLSAHGITATGIKLDLKKLIARKDQVVSEVVKGVDFLMKKNKIKRFEGIGMFEDKNTVKVSANGQTSAVLKAEKVLIATGSAPAELPFMPFDGKTVISSTEALSLEKVPKKLVIVGAGVIGLELGSVWSRLGSEVHIIEMLPNLLPTCDGKIAAYAKRLLEGQGLRFYMEHKVKALKGKKVIVETPKGESLELDADKVLVATGRKPYTENLGLENIGINTDSAGRIPVNKYQTEVSGVYAVGDVIEGPMLAHKAMEEGIAAAEIMAGKAGHVNYDATPYIVYTWPEIAWVGIGEEEAKKQGYEISVGKAFFKANGRAKAMDESDGQVKVIADKNTDRLLGLFIIGPRASDMIAEAAIAMEFHASAEDIARSMHAHPTLSEVVLEAALDVEKRAIHA